MPIGITPELESGKCSLCGKDASVRLIVDNEKDLVVRICEGCAKESQLTAGELLEKHGKPNAAAKKAQVLGKEDWIKQQSSLQERQAPPN
jgi:hypothetical protein